MFDEETMRELLINLGLLPNPNQVGALAMRPDPEDPRIDHYRRVIDQLAREVLDVRRALDNCWKARVESDQRLIRFERLVEFWLEHGHDGLGPLREEVLAYVRG